MLKDMRGTRVPMHLPEYENPPLVEVILGVQFERLSAFKNAHLGAFWKMLDRDWQTPSDAAPLQPQFERFEDSAKWGHVGGQLLLVSDPPLRVQIKNRKGDQMIQLQNGRLHFNWLGEAGGSYPHYDKVRDHFTWALGQLMEFSERENLGPIKPNQWEVTYLNHIPHGTVWRTPKDWGFFRPLAGLPAMDGLFQGESFGGEWHFVLPDRRGRLHVNWKHGIASGGPAKEMIVLNLTARGGVASADPDIVPSVVKGLDLGHETIVRSFAELMSDEANSYWGRKHACN
jgi:uncharacterized protein (TIGR04255 family)